jgi:hypothetical protein
MSYDYNREVEKIYSRDGVRALLVIRDAAEKLSRESGAVSAEALLRKSIASDSWMTMACIDFLVSVGDLVEISTRTGGMWQQRVFRWATR